MSQLARMDEAVDQELKEAAGGGSLLLASLPSDVGPSSASSPSSSSSNTGGSGGGWGGGIWPGGSTMLASMSFGMGRASRVVLDALSHAARHAPPKRPSIIRPSQMRRGRQQDGVEVKK